MIVNMLILNLFVILSLILFHWHHERGIRRIFRKTQTLRDEFMEQIDRLEKTGGANIAKLDDLTKRIDELSHLFSDFQYEMRYDLFLNYTLQLAGEANAKGLINKEDYERFEQLVHETKVDKYSESLGH